MKASDGTSSIPEYLEFPLRDRSPAMFERWLVPRRPRPRIRFAALSNRA